VTTQVGNVYVHSFLRGKKGNSIVTERVSEKPGFRDFACFTQDVMVKGDIILKWAEDGTTKTVWQIMAVHADDLDSRKAGEPHRYVGEIRDLYYHDEVTPRIATAVVAADADLHNRTS
jgi:hypothetical protein